MTPWLAPAAAAAFWGGVFLSPHAGGGRLPWALVALGLGATAAAVALVRPAAGAEVLRRAGLIGGEAPALSALGEGGPAGHGPPTSGLALALAGLVMLGSGLGAAQAARLEAGLLPAIAPARVEMEGTLRTDPARSRFGWWALVDVSEVRWEAGSARLRETVWASGEGEPPGAARWDGVALSGTIRGPEAGAFADSLRRRGVAVVLSVGELRRVGPSANPIVRGAQAFREAVSRSIRLLFGPREGGLVLGLALGDESGLDPGLERDFRAAGLGHLLVVSGGNLAMVLGPIVALAMLLRLPPAVRFAAGAATAVFFVVLTGVEPSVLRAGVMAVLAMAGLILGRPRTATSVLAGAVLILLLSDPRLVWNVGFQLSVAATAGMAALATPLAGRLRFLGRPLALATGATLGAQAGVAPLLLFHFHEVPLVALIANVLAFPAVAPAMLLGLAAAAAWTVWPLGGEIVAAAALVPLRYLEFVADRMASAPVAWVTSGGGPAPLAGGAAALAALAWKLRSGRRLPRTAVVAAGLLLPLFVWATALRSGPPSGLVVRFLDVGQGDAALVTSPEGATVLIDGGPEPDVVAHKLVALGVRRLDAVVATHAHEDHVEGLVTVLARFPVGVVLEPGCDTPTPSYSEFLQAVGDEGIPVRNPRAGEAVAVGDLRLDVLSPEDCFVGTDSDANNDSLVFRLSRGEDSVLFAGDAEVPAQQILLDEEVPLAAPVLKVPHHGGATSLPEFFGAVAPEVAIVSVGADNDYGHPAPEAIEWAERSGAEVLRTDAGGDITLRFAPGGLLVESG